MSDNDGYEADVRAWLEGVDVPPSRIETRHVVAVGRARVRRRRHLAVAGTAVAAVAVLAAVPAVTQVWQPDAGPLVAQTPSVTAGSGSPEAGTLRCTVTVLAAPDGLAERGVTDPDAVKVSGMDPTGRFVVGDTYGDRNNSPATVVWDGADPAVIPVDAHHVVAHAVNSRGDVVGSGVRGPMDTDDFGWVYRDGEVTVLPLPDGYQRVLFNMDINEAGDVVGNVQDADHHTGVVIWPASAPEQPRLLSEPDGDPVTGEAITDDGYVVGWIAGSTGGYVWDPDGVGRELPLPDGAEQGTIAAASGQWAVGYAGFPASQEAIEARIPPELRDDEHVADATVPVPVRWDLSDGDAVEVAGHVDNGRVLLNTWGFGGRAVNAAGDVVVGYPNPQVLRADGRTVELPVSGDGAAPDPVAISEAGDRVAGTLVADTWDDPVDLDAPGGSGTGPDEPADLPRPAVWDC